jgi:hypothetical protein
LKKLEKFNCAVTITDGKLQKCAITADGGPDMWAGTLNWQDVKAPVTQDFLNAVNEALGVSFAVEDFSDKKGAKKP